MGIYVALKKAKYMHNMSTLVVHMTHGAGLIMHDAAQ
jgi:hypothetical protein